MPPIVLTNDCKDDQFDGVIVVTDSVEHLPTSVQSTQSTIQDYLKVPAVWFLLSLMCFPKIVADCWSIRTSWCVSVHVEVIMKWILTIMNSIGTGSIWKLCGSVAVPKAPSSLWHRVGESVGGGIWGRVVIFLSRVKGRAIMLSLTHTSSVHLSVLHQYAYDPLQCFDAVRWAAGRASGL